MQARLEKAGHDTLMDIEFLTAGDDWRDELDQAIRDSHVLVVIMTPDAAVSEYVAYEWAFALRVHGRIIPLALKKSPFHPRLDVLQHLDFTDKVRPWPALFAEVAKAAEAKPITTIPVPVSAPPVIQQAVRSLDSLNKGEQMAGIKSLAQTDHPVAQELLVLALQHPVKNVRITAALEFPNKKDVRRLPGLIDYCRESESSEMIELEYWSSSVEAIPYLLEALQDQSSYVRKIVAKILGRIGDASVVPRLIDALQDKDEHARRSVAEALGKIGDVTAIPALHEFLKDASDDVRAAAIKALGELNDDTVVDELLHCLQDDIEVCQVHAASAAVLGRFGVIAAVPKLRQWLQNKDEFEGIRTSAAEALGLLGDKSAIDDLREVFCLMTGDDTWYGTLKPAVGVALIRLQGVKVFPLMIEAIKPFTNGTIPVVVVEAMGTVGEPAIPASRGILNFNNVALSSAAAQALKTIGTVESLTAAKQWERGK